MSNFTADPKTVLREIAAELREHPERWTQSAFGLDPDGRHVDSWDSTACKWCLAGLINKRSPSASEAISRMHFAWPVRDLLEKHTEGNVILWNDTTGRTVQQVIEMCERAAA